MYKLRYWLNSVLPLTYDESNMFVSAFSNQRKSMGVSQWPINSIKLSLVKYKFHRILRYCAALIYHEKYYFMRISNWVKHERKLTIRCTLNYARSGVDA